MNKQSNLAVIGASGHLGKHLVARLKDDDRFKLIGIVRNKDKFKNPGGIEIRETGDIHNTDKLGQSLKDIDVIINTTYITFAPQISEAIEKSGNNRLKQIIFTGSTGIYTKLIKPEKNRKLIAEKFIGENFKIPWTILRPTMIYGHCGDRNISRFVRFLNRTPVIPVIGKGNALIQPVLIDDLVEVFFRSILNRKVFYQIIDVGGRNPVRNMELFQIVSNQLGKKRIFVPVPPGLILFLYKTLSRIKKLPVSEEQILRFQEDKNVSIEKLEKLLNYTTKPVEEGISILIRRMIDKNCF